ncbi:MAG: hypothetical protein IPJ88_09445 [Myxococcales bacterium]|nr:MAG: hypothetical protein IPJ88_09445 [Myxococcales bacterium]
MPPSAKVEKKNTTPLNDSTEETLSKTELNNLKPLIRMAEKVRQLKFRKALAIYTESQQGITQNVIARMDTEDLFFEQSIYRMLGLIKTSEN